MQNLDQHGEINLADYVKVIFKRKWLITAIIALALIASFVYTITSPKIYKIDSALELGSIDESPTQLIEKINNQVFNGKYKIGVRAENPKNTNLINLISQSSDYKNAQLALQEIANAILLEHQEKLELEKNLIKSDISKLENKFNLINNNIKITQNKILPLQNDISRILNKIDSKEREIKALQNQISALQEQLIYEQDPGTQYALFNAQQELEINNQNIENLYLTINSLERTIQDYNISINNQDASKENLELDINKLNKFLQEIRLTKIIKQPVISKAPIKPRPLLNLAIAGVLGLFIGVFIAFAKEWWQENL